MIHIIIPVMLQTNVMNLSVWVKTQLHSLCYNVWADAVDSVNYEFKYT